MHIKNQHIDNAEDLDIVMPMYNWLDYSDNSITAGSLWNYYRDEVNETGNENNDANNYKLNNNKTITSKSFEYKKKIIENTPADNNTLDTEVVVPSKYLSIFKRFFNLPLSNCEKELDLRWTKNCIISEILRTAPLHEEKPVEATGTKGARFHNWCQTLRSSC